jgi:transposase InsO family protein
LQTELERLHGLHLSTATIWHLLNKHGVSAALRPRRRIKGPKRYSRPVPGDRIQIDSCKIRKGLYQFTAIDDCTRMRVLGLYPNRKQDSAIQFLHEKVLPGFAFPLQRIQTDRGSEFLGEGFQNALRQAKIKLRPTPPRSPHLNGKVERSQQTDRVEFWATVDTSLPAEDLAPLLVDWERHYNTARPHSGLQGKTPQERFQETVVLVPPLEQVHGQFDLSKERWHTNWPYTWVYTPERGFHRKRWR